MKSLRKISLFFSNQLTLTVLAIVIIAHLVMMYFYLQESQQNRQTVNRENMIQKIINAIYTLEATPLENRAKAVAAMADPNMEATLTPTPASELQFQQVSYWKIGKALRHNLTSFNLSIQMENNQWLNVKAAIRYHFLYRQLFLFSAEIIIFATLFISAWSIRRFTRPLKNFKLAAERLGIDLHSKPLDIYGPPVVQEAALAINQMQNRIQDLIRDRTQMLAAISHDLRTPITRMQLRSQFIDDTTLQNNLMHDLTEMSKMIDEVLSFARDDTHSESKQLLDAVSFLDAICEDYHETGTTIRCQSDNARLIISAKPITLKRAISNIINNAKRYGNEIDVRIYQRHNCATILIEDDGPGIQPSELNNVFAPFYREDKSRNKDTGGVGLGLAVTRDIIRTHDGYIELSNRDKMGLCVTITLPLANK